MLPSESKQTQYLYDLLEGGRVCSPAWHLVIKDQHPTQQPLVSYSLVALPMAMRNVTGRWRYCKPMSTFLQVRPQHWQYRACPCLWTRGRPVCETLSEHIVVEHCKSDGHLPVLKIINSLLVHKAVVSGQEVEAVHGSHDERSCTAPREHWSQHVPLKCSQIHRCETWSCFICVIFA